LSADQAVVYRSNCASKFNIYGTFGISDSTQPIKMWKIRPDPTCGCTQPLDNPWWDWFQMQAGVEYDRSIKFIGEVGPMMILTYLLTNQCKRSYARWPVWTLYL